MESSAVASTKHNDERSMATTTICHILPCSIDQDITAPIAQYFHPTMLNLDNILPDKKQKDASTTTTTTTTVMAAQFRGRGLLCAVDTPASLLASSTTTIANDNSIQGDDSKSSNANEEGMTTTAMTATTTTTLSKLPSNIMGVVLSPSSSSSTTTATTTTTTNNLKVIETFHEIYNWQHEHDVQRVIFESRQLNNEKYGLHAVREWCELAQSIHDPIPVSPP
jgi:hypothetical protein